MSFTLSAGKAPVLPLHSPMYHLVFSFFSSIVIKSPCQVDQPLRSQIVRVIDQRLRAFLKLRTSGSLIW